MTFLVENVNSYYDCWYYFAHFVITFNNENIYYKILYCHCAPRQRVITISSFVFSPVCRMNNESVNSEREWECGMTQAKYLQFFHQKSLSLLSPIVIMISVMILASSSAVWCDLSDFLRVIVSFYRVILTMLSQNFVFLIFTSYLGKQKKYIHNFHSLLHWMSIKYQTIPTYFSPAILWKCGSARPLSL